VALGVRADTSREDAQRIRLVNGLALAGLVLTTSSHLGLGRWYEPLGLATTVATLFGLAGVLGLQAAGRSRAAAWLYHGVIVASILAGSAFVAVDAGNFYFLIVFTALPFLLFPSRDGTGALATALLVALCLVVVLFGWDLDGDLPRRIATYGPYQVVNQAVIAAAMVLIGAGSRSLHAVVETDLEREREKSERLLRNVFPEAIGRRLQAGGEVVAERFGDASVLFCTVVGLERLAAELAPEAFLAGLHRVFARMERCCGELGVEKIKTTGATFVAVAGLPVYRGDHAEALVELGLRLQAEFAAEPDIRLRIGVNSGPVVAGVIGRSRPTYDIWGDTVNTAQRMDMHAAPGDVHVSPLTFAKVNYRFECVAREGLEIKGKGPMKTWVVRGARGGRT
jgi:class 3 adenylate cyclase